MKTLYLSIIAIFLVFAGLMLSYDNTAYGIWVRQSPQELLNDSATIFVGNITSVNVLPFGKQQTYAVEENGIDKTIVKNYTLHLDEYAVNVEEFLKNPQNTNKITVRQPIIGLPTGLGGLGGFKAGDHVLFYVKNLDGNNTYSPESFIIPKSCAAKDVLTQNRLEARGESFTIQNGIKVDSNFTANKPIQFVDNEDVDTLSGKSLDTVVRITKNTGSSPEIVFSKEIHSEAKPCQWIASAEWEFTPQEGEYRMDVTMKEDNKTYSQYVAKFSVKSDVVTFDHLSPLKQFKSGISASDVQCTQGLELVIKAEDGSPSCVTSDTAIALTIHGWAISPKSTIMHVELDQSHYPPNNLDYYFVKGMIYTASGPMQNSIVSILGNGITIGNAMTDPTGCFQFNSWNNTVINQEMHNASINHQESYTLKITTAYLGDGIHDAVNDTKNAVVYFQLFPVPPLFYVSSTNPSTIQVKQGESINLELSVKYLTGGPVGPMDMIIQRLPCGVTYEVPSNNNITTSDNGTFNISIKTQDYTHVGKYYLDVIQDTSHFENPNIIPDSYIGTINLEVLPR